MDIEQLRLILNLIGAAGDGAFWVFAIWMGKDIFLSILGLGTLITVVVLITKLIRQTLISNRFSYTVGDLLEIRGFHVGFEDHRMEAIQIIKTLKRKK